MKLRSINLASGSTTTSPTQGKQSVFDRFWYEAPLFKFRKCIEYMASATVGVKNPPETGVASVT